MNMAGHAVSQSSAPCRGAVPVNAQEVNLPRSAENELHMLQAGIATPSASVVAPSMAELNMVLKILQTLVPEFPKLEPGDPGTRARRFQQWLLQVTQAL